jgi:hypothetical protein
MLSLKQNAIPKCDLFRRSPIEVREKKELSSPRTNELSGTPYLQTQTTSGERLD